MSRRDELLERLVAQARGVYSLPAVAVEVLSLADNPQTGAAQLKAVVERDPALTAKLLRVVNSSMFGVTRKVTDLAQAVALLGVKPLKLLVLGFSLPERLLAAKASDVLRRYWTRALTRAVAARELAAIVAPRHGDELFIAGLLADLGAPVLVQEFDDRYLRIYRRAVEGRLELCEAERRTFGFDHLALTARMLEAWQLPEMLIDAGPRSLAAAAAGDASTDASDAKRSLAPIVSAADRLALLVVEERTELWPELLDETEERWRIDAARLSQIADNVERQIGELGELLNVELAEKHSFRATLQRAQRLLQAASEDAVAALLGNEPAGDAKPRDVEPFTTDAQAAADFRALHESLETASPDEGRHLAAAPSAKKIGPHDLPSLLAVAATACRQARVPLSLILIEIDGFDEGLTLHGPMWASYVESLLTTACDGLEWPGLRTLAQSASRRALVVANADRSDVRRLVDDVTREFRELSPIDERGAATLSFGTATIGLPSRHFKSADLLTAAERCLFAARGAAAGDTSKGIEVY